MTFRLSVLASVLALGAVVAVPRAALANPHALPFTYPYETSLQGAVEVEQYLDLTPVRVDRDLPDGSTDTVHSFGAALTTELEYGLSDRLELAWYFAFKQEASAEPAMEFDGVKQRLRLRLAEEGQWPVNVGLYLETAEMHDELELEEKVLLSRRFNALNLMANLWVEQEYNYQDKKMEHIFNPTLGAAYELSPNFSLGLEYWARGNFDEKLSQAHHYVGPTFLAQGETAWISLGTYLRLDDLGVAPPVDDPFGRIWFRTIIGIPL
ncbi:MAG TPA: hypothetical protein VL137_16125 [Polyangiaceae bacterium]|nr:hypothetical protein [Polyangiaceae bacterium]